MASAYSKRTLDTDFITLRRVFAKQSDNSPPPPNYVLASYGDGTTYWAQPSTLGQEPTFNQVVMDSNIYIGSNNHRFLYINQRNGIILSTLLSSTTSSLQIYNTDFQQIDVSGATNLYAYSNFLLNNTLTFNTSGFLSSGTSPSENLVVIQTLREAPALSTNIVSFQSLKIISTISSPLDVTTAAGTLFEKLSPSTFITLAGVGDFKFTTNFNPATVGLELSSFNAAGFLGLSSIVGTSFFSTMSTISSIYTQKDIFSTAFISLSTTESFLYSTSRSTVIGVSNYTQLTYNQKMGDTLARATIIQLNDQFGLVNSALSTISSVKTPVYIMTSTTKGIIDKYSTATSLSTSTFADFTAGSIFNFTVNGMIVVSTQLSTLSTNVGLQIGNMSNSFLNAYVSYGVSTVSTVNNLGTIGYISSPSIESSIRGLGTVPYISTASLRSTVSGLTSIYTTSNTFISSLVSTTDGLFSRQQIISTLTLASSLISTVRGLEIQTGTVYVSTAALGEVIPSTTKGIIDYAAQNGYISTQSLMSTILSTFSFGISSLYVLNPYLFSTLQSTTDGVLSTNNLQYISSSKYREYPNELSSLGYVYVTQLQSTADYFLAGKETNFTSSLQLTSFLFEQQVKMTQLGAVTVIGSLAQSNSYFSSVLFSSLSGYDSKFTNAKFATIEYTPNIFFSYVPNQYSNDSNFRPVLSTIIQIGDTVYPDTAYIDRVRFSYFNSNDQGASNIYTKRIRMQMKKDDFLQAATNGLAIVHNFRNFRSLGYGGGAELVSSQITLNTPLSNSLFISIYN